MGLTEKEISQLLEQLRSGRMEECILKLKEMLMPVLEQLYVKNRELTADAHIDPESQKYWSERTAAEERTAKEFVGVVGKALDIQVKAKFEKDIKPKLNVLFDEATRLATREKVKFSKPSSVAFAAGIEAGIKGSAMVQGGRNTISKDTDKASIRAKLAQKYEEREQMKAEESIRANLAKLAEMRERVERSRVEAKAKAEQSTMAQDAAREMEKARLARLARLREQVAERNQMEANERAAQAAQQAKTAEIEQRLARLARLKEQRAERSRVDASEKENTQTAPQVAKKAEQLAQLAAMRQKYGKKQEGRQDVPSSESRPVLLSQKAATAAAAGGSSPKSDRDDKTKDQESDSLKGKDRPRGGGTPGRS